MEYWKDFWKNYPGFDSNNSHVKVGRTILGEPIAPKDWEKTVAFLQKKILLSKEKSVLDLCCGNGLISAPFAKHVKRIIAIDFSPILINELKSLKIQNIDAQCRDVNKLNFKGKRFDVIIIYFAIQHFSQTETISLLRKAKNWLNPGGCIYIGDIPDECKIWEFFNIKKFRNRYLKSIEQSQPIIGNWFSKDFFLHLAEYLNYKEVEIIKQKNYMINNHYRFDVLLKK